MPYHEDQLPDLPLAQRPDTGWNNFQLGPRITFKKGKLVYEAKPYTATLGNRGISLRGPIGGVQLDTRAKYNGDWQINGSMPLLGGNLGFNAQDNDGQRRYGLRYERTFR